VSIQRIARLVVVAAFEDISNPGTRASW